MPVTDNYQIEYNGVTFGSVDGEAAIELVRTDLFSGSSIRTSDVNVPLGDGVFAGNDFLGAKTFVVDLELWARNEADFSTRIKEVLQATRPQRRRQGQDSPEKPLVFQMPGFGASDQVQINCRPRARTGPVIDLEATIGHKALVSIQFVASDPRIYSASETVFTTGIQEETGGLTFDATPDFTFGSGSSGSVLAPNTGTDEAWPSFTLTGPVVNPSIQWQSGDFSKTLSFQGTLGSGETLVIDSHPTSRTVLLNGTASRYSWLQDPSQWFSLLPEAEGANTLTLRGTGTDSETELEIRYRSAWS